MNPKINSKLSKKEKGIGGFFTAKASEEALAKHWLTKEEDEAWAYLDDEAIKESAETTRMLIKKLKKS